MNEPRRWFNQSQPQTLQIGVMLLYINAVFLLLGSGFFLPAVAIAAALAAGGYGIANEQKWGYQVGTAAAVLNLALLLAAVGFGGVLGSFNALVAFGFDLALVALLLHPQSREYQKIWFR